MKTLRKDIENFDRRWKIPQDADNKFNEFLKFRSRVLQSFDRHLGYVLSNTDDGLRYMTLVGVPPTTSKRDIYRYEAEMEEFRDRQRRKDRGEVVDGTEKPFPRVSQPVEFHTTEIWDYLSEVDNLHELVKCIQCVFWLQDDVDFDEQESWGEYIGWPFLQSILRDIEISRVHIAVKTPTLWANMRDTIFYPSGAQLLDENLVNDNLEWLDGYSESAKESFTSALSEFSEKHYLDSIDKMRKSLETFMKSLFHNDKSLEKNLKEGHAGVFLENSKNVSSYTKNMYGAILHSYIEYQNNVAKHLKDRNRPEPTEAEAEFIIYQTGSLMRFLIQLDSHSRQ